jgi:hypothetical protein
MSKSWPKPADPNDRADYVINWTLDTGDIISASAWSIVDPSTGLSITTTTFTDSTTSVWLTGGAAGDSAKLLNHITTAAGRQFDQTVTLKIKER